MVGLYLNQSTTTLDIASNFLLYTVNPQAAAIDKKRCMPAAAAKNFMVKPAFSRSLFSMSQQKKIRPLFNIYSFPLLFTFEGLN